MKCFFCDDRENLEMVILMLWNAEQVIFICPSCIRLLNGKSLDLNFSALKEGIKRRFDESDRRQILKQKCPKCHRDFKAVLESKKENCAFCLVSFAQTVLALINLLGNDRKSIICPDMTHPEIPFEKRAALSAALRDLEQDPHFKIAHLKERLEALVQDEKFEEAKLISEMIKKLELSSIENAERR